MFFLLVLQDMLAVSLCLLSVFALISLLSGYAGRWGEAFSNFSNALLGSPGLILWLFLLWSGFKMLFHGVGSWFLRWALVFLGIYLVSAEVAALWKISGLPLPEWFRVGHVGTSVVLWGMEKVGGLGLVLGGLLLLLASASLAAWERPNVLLAHMFHRVRSSLSLRRTSEERSSDIEFEPLLEDQLEKLRGERPSGLDSVEDEGEEGPAKDEEGEPEELVGSATAASLPDPSGFPPPLEMLPLPPKEGDGEEELRSLVESGGAQIEATLSQFGIKAKVVEVVIGPTVVQYQLRLAPGVKVSKVASLSKELAMGLASLAEKGLRIEAPIPGKSYVGVEVPNPRRRIVYLRELLESEEFSYDSYFLTIPLGLNVSGDLFVVGLEELPHLLVAGTTGSGKSVFISSLITSLSFFRTPRELRFILVDPKRVELSVFSELPHLLTDPIANPKRALAALKWTTSEMERRYGLFASRRVRDIFGYNGSVRAEERLPFIVLVVDELADLMMTSPKDTEDHICRLAQMARATGIHLVLATQRPSVNVITGLIKANVPARVAFALPTQVDSRTVLDMAGAERLLGKGDMLFVSTQNPRPVRLQGPWVDERTVEKVVKYLAGLFDGVERVDLEEDSSGEDGGDGGDLDDPLLTKAVGLVMATGVASASMLQRRLKIGFSRASRLVDTMERLGIVGPMEGSKPREILVDEDAAREILRQNGVL